ASGTVGALASQATAASTPAASPVRARARRGDHGCATMLWCSAANGAPANATSYVRRAAPRSMRGHGGKSAGARGIRTARCGARALHRVQADDSEGPAVTRIVEVALGIVTSIGG